MKELFRLTVVLTIICSLAATTLAIVYNITKDPIAYQQRLKMLKAIKAVQPNYDNEPDQEFVDITRDNASQANTRFYLTKKGESFTGVVFTVSAVGYGGPIELMLGLNPEGTITGIQVLKHSETPGLGAKITEEKFLQQFPSKSAQNTTWKLKKEGGDIDKISGATISPKAVVTALSEGLTLYSKHREEILKGGRPKEAHGILQ